MERTERKVSRYAEVVAVLSDAAYTVPAVPGDVPPSGVAWLRANVARFSTAAPHERRRAAAVAVLADLDPAKLRRAAHDRTLRGHQDPEWIAPVSVLTEALGLPDGVAVVAAVRAAAGAYQPHTAVTPEADAAVERLVDAFGGTPDEATATRIGLLVQACDATAGLIRNAAATGDSAPAEAVLTETLRHDPPVPATRRVAPDDGATVLVEIAAANRDPAVFAEPNRFDPARPDAARHLTFGVGPHACPGGPIALALASGVLDALRDTPS